MIECVKQKIHNTRTHAQSTCNIVTSNTVSLSLNSSNSEPRCPLITHHYYFLRFSFYSKAVQWSIKCHNQEIFFLKRNKQNLFLLFSDAPSSSTSVLFESRKLSIIFALCRSLSQCQNLFQLFQSGSVEKLMKEKITEALKVRLSNVWKTLRMNLWGIQKELYNIVDYWLLIDYYRFANFL